MLVWAVAALGTWVALRNRHVACGGSWCSPRTVLGTCSLGHSTVRKQSNTGSGERNGSAAGAQQEAGAGANQRAGSNHKAHPRDFLGCRGLGSAGFRSRRWARACRYVFRASPISLRCLHRGFDNDIRTSCPCTPCIVRNTDYLRSRKPQAPSSNSISISISSIE